MHRRRASRQSPQTRRPEATATRMAKSGGNRLQPSVPPRSGKSAQRSAAAAGRTRRRALWGIGTMERSDQSSCASGVTSRVGIVDISSLKASSTSWHSLSTTRRSAISTPSVCPKASLQDPFLAAEHGKGTYGEEKPTRVSSHIGFFHFLFSGDKTVCSRRKS